MILATLLPLVTIIGGVTLVVFLMKFRKDRLALLIEKGLYRRLTPREIQRRFYLVGIILLVLGVNDERVSISSNNFSRIRIEVF